MDAQFWDDRYRSRDQLFSGAPNGVLVTEVTGLVPGRALDVGAGEGGDTLWLAERGWQVTATDISSVALDRGARAAAARGVAGRVQWLPADLTKEPPAAGAYDLVSAQYFPLPRQPEHTALRGLLYAVAPGGTLLIGSHDLAELPPGEEHGFDPSDYYQPGDIAKLLDHDWTILINETRPRTAPAPAGTHHAHDTVLRAQRVR
ncbi:MAG: class I SAM-dependent methyltransferase [Streptosporangiaceae bacterium]